MALKKLVVAPVFCPYAGLIYGARKAGALKENGRMHPPRLTAKRFFMFDRKL